MFTWNDSPDILRSYLQAVQQKHPNVHFQVSIDSDVHFFNAYLDNRQGQLYTRVYHDPSLQAYTLPYVVGHPKVKYGDWLRSALLRAVCYCSQVEDFHHERLYLELTCLVNGYSFMFVEKHVHHFFIYFNAPTMRYRMDQNAYGSFRRQWFDYFDTRHHLTDELQRFDDQGKLFRFFYFYDYGPRTQFNQDFHDLWSTQFHNHPQLSDTHVKILLTTKQLHSLNALLARYRSSSALQQ